jgi:paraquat-inducible protein B
VNLTYGYKCEHQIKAQEDELVQCRIDHYQTLEKVQVSVFAKKVNKEESTVQFKNEEVNRLAHTINDWGLLTYP